MIATGRSAAGVSIGVVLAELRPDFPDVTISKIRFLESEGLVRPARTPAGYRQFSVADVERLRYVLRAQRDHYLPLRVIREQLEAIDAGRPAQPRGVVRRLTREQLLAAAGIQVDELADLERFGLVRSVPGGGYLLEDARIAGTVRQLAGFGVRPRHLGAYRLAADRQVGLLEKVVSALGRQRDVAARRAAEEALRELIRLSVALHSMLVKVGLRRVTGH